MSWIVPITALISMLLAQGLLPPGYKPPSPVPPGSYAGDEACARCHRRQFDTFKATAHHLTSQLASAESIHGDFSAPANRMKTAKPDVFFVMEKRSDGFFQTGNSGVPPNTQTRSERFDVVLGSGHKGQTYAYWKNDFLFQLPISYWAASKSWVNSPGLPDGGIAFDRVINPRCMECHATYAQVIPGAQNRYDRTSVQLGIGCEKCHGPGKAHIDRHSGADSPDRVVDAPGSRDVINTGKLTRDQQMDLCATCHSNATTPVAVPFSYLPGEPFDKYFAPSAITLAPSAEVHGNQAGLLKSSRCYRSSEMTCSTCHNVHVVQRDTQSMSGRCLTCHKTEACGVFTKAGRAIENRCVDCHMPNLRSEVISVSAGAPAMAPEVRTHAIKIYREQSDALLKTMVN